MIKCFVINLDHRKDRLKRIRKHLNSNGLYFTRFQAVNALETNSKTLTKNIVKYGPLGKISIGDMACFQSHLMLWKKIYKTEKKPVLVLEDDAYISKRGFELLRNTNWIPKNAKIIKCEKFGNKRHRVLLSPKLKSIDGFHLHYLMSKHSGTGGYIITPDGAKYLVEKSVNVNVPVDHFLFNPNNSEIFKDLKPLQLYPAICEQVDQSSDIHIHRENFSYLSLSDIIREFKRGYYEVKLLPKQFFQFLFMKYRLKKIVISE